MSETAPMMPSVADDADVHGNGESHDACVRDQDSHAVGASGAWGDLRRRPTRLAARDDLCWDVPAPNCKYKERSRA